MLRILHLSLIVSVFRPFNTKNSLVAASVTGPSELTKQTSQQKSKSSTASLPGKIVVLLAVLLLPSLFSGSFSELSSNANASSAAAILASTAFGRTYNLKSGDSLRLGQDIVTCDSPSPLPSCEEKCQYFSDGTCHYKTRCEYQNNCLLASSCEKFDTFDNICRSEKTQVVCSPTTSCTEFCQYFDTFDNECKYRTKCTIQGNCIQQTTCERWDSFEKQCLSEMTKTKCW